MQEPGWLMTETQTTSLKDLLSRHTHDGVLYRTLDNGKIECYACGHRCIIGEGRDGICKVRFNRDGVLHVPWGYAGGIQLDPVEKKPFFHVLPGNLALSFGMLGCDYHCGYCQNWVTSQALRDPEAVSLPEFFTPKDFVDIALKRNAAIVTSTYNEPLITSEWGVEIFKLAKQSGLVTSYVSNGNGTPEVLEYIQPWVDLYKVDLKGFNDKQYRKLGGVLQNVLDTIELLHQKKFWLEIVTLIVPGFNDSEHELREIANFISSVSPEIPWHVTAFHSDYNMMDTPNTSVASLLRAVDIGESAGLFYVYAGNMPGSVRNHENTYCPNCHGKLIERRGYTILNNQLKNGSCPTCETAIPGVWKTPVTKHFSTYIHS